MNWPLDLQARGEKVLTGYQRPGPDGVENLASEISESLQ